ncbi:hypothetical protein B7494_g4575 [Chlorociboria aeruginascens]|nr:hypothetical protein B7494_g4575 [Chlorociboria aeruginascens]
MLAPRLRHPFYEYPILEPPAWRTSSAVSRISTLRVTSQKAQYGPTRYCKEEKKMADEGLEGDFPIDRAIIAVMPPGATVVSASSHGTSNWSKTAKICATLADGTRKRYFLKCAVGDTAQAVVEGEFHSISAIDALVPGLVPKAQGWGHYTEDNEKVYFYLGDFLDMNLRVAPEPAEFSSHIAELHLKGTSPNGMFGFPVATVCGKMQHTVKWEKSWALFFAGLLRDVLESDQKANGEWLELQLASNQVLEKVIPRLLGALQSEGREIKPSLIHGDLWESNVCVDMESSDIKIFDAGCYYGHNEMEFGTWRGSWAHYFRSEAYIHNYLQHVPVSEPIEEWDDRNRLYSIQVNLSSSAGHPGNDSRQTAYNDMCFLCEKYAPLEGLAKYNLQFDPKVTGVHRVLLSNSSKL